MSIEWCDSFICDMCMYLQILDVDVIIVVGWFMVEGFEVIIDVVEEDIDVFYLNFDYGIVIGGCMLCVFCFMFEVNVIIYV